MPSTKWVELVEKKEFTAIALDLRDEIFIVLVAFVANSDSTYLSQRVQIVSLKKDKVFALDLPKYFDFTNIFFLVLVAELLKYIGINNYIIELLDSK